MVKNSSIIDDHISDVEGAGRQKQESVPVRESGVNAPEVKEADLGEGPTEGNQVSEKSWRTLEEAFPDKEVRETAKSYMTPGEGITFRHGQNSEYVYIDPYSRVWKDSETYRQSPEYAEDQKPKTEEQKSTVDQYLGTPEYGQTGYLDTQRAEASDKYDLKEFNGIGETQLGDAYDDAEIAVDTSGRNPTSEQQAETTRRQAIGVAEAHDQKGQSEQQRLARETGKSVERKGKRLSWATLKDSIGAAIAKAVPDSELQNLSEYPTKLSRGMRVIGSVMKQRLDERDMQLKQKGIFDSRSNVFSDTIYVSTKIMPNEIGLGTTNIREALRDPRSNIVDLFNRTFNTEFTVDELLEDLTPLIEKVNGRGFEVVFEKFPVNIRTSVQVRTLRIFDGRGIALHPTQAKGFNADFDGDPGSINFSPEYRSRFERSMTQLIDIDGKCMIDPDYFPLDSYALPWDEKVSAEDREHALKQRKKNPEYNKLRSDVVFTLNEGVLSWDASGNISENLADLYISVCNEGGQSWARFLRGIEEEAHRIAQEEKTKRRGRVRQDFMAKRIDFYTSKILQSFYEYGIERRGLSFRVDWLMTEGNYNYDSKAIDEMTSEYKPIIRNLVYMVEEISSGRAVISFQSFTRFYTKQWGDLHGDPEGGKNVPFRLIADFGKCIKRTDLINIGMKTYGINPDTMTKLSPEEFSRLQEQLENGEITQEEFDEHCGVTIHDLWEMTCAAGVSRLISGRMNQDSAEIYVSTYIKTQIRKQLALPVYATEQDEEFAYIEDDQDRRFAVAQKNIEIFRKFMYRFQALYNYEFRMLNSAQTHVRMGNTIWREKTLLYEGFEKMEDCAKAVAEVWGDYRIGRIFPNLEFVTTDEMMNTTRENDRDDKVREYIKDMTIQEFISLNRFDWFSEVAVSGENVGDEYNKETVTKFRAISYRCEHGTFTPMDIIYKLADRKNTQAGEYFDSWMEATSICQNALRRIKDDIEKDDWTRYAQDIIQIIEGISPRMFNHFDMLTYIDFTRNKWGKKLLEAESVEQFRGIMVSMIIKYRMSRLSKIYEELKENDESDNQRSASQQEQRGILEDQWVQEAMSLESSSIVWEVILDEISKKDGVFETLIKKDNFELGDITLDVVDPRSGLPYKSDVVDDGRVVGQKLYREKRHDQPCVYKRHSYPKFTLQGYEFWNAHDSYDGNLLDFLTSDENFLTKMYVLRDVVSLSTGMTYSMPVKTILGQLVYNPDPLTVGTKFEQDSGIRGEIDFVKSSIDKASSYMKSSPEEIFKIANRIINEYSKNAASQEEFELKLNRYATEPGAWLYVSPKIVADAMSTPFEKTYEFTEKLRNPEQVNGFFNAIVSQHCGGPVTHLFQVDNRVLNMAGFDQLSEWDIIHILGDPNFVLHGYDEFGVPCELSRKSLCNGDMSTEALFEFLRKNPRIACACRRHIAGVQADVDGRLTINALIDNTESSDDGLSLFDQSFAVLNDRPRFLSIIGLLTPANGMVGRNMAKLYERNIRTLTNFLIQEVVKRYKNPRGIVDKDGIEKDVNEILGITQRNLMASRVDGRYGIVLDESGEFISGEPSAEDVRVVEGSYEQILNEIYDAIETLGDSHVGDKIRKSYQINESYPVDTSSFGIDIESYMSFFDIRQQLSGARVQVMIGVEGQVTSNTYALHEFIRDYQDKYVTITRDTPQSFVYKLSHYVEGEDPAGNTLRKKAKANGGMHVVKIPVDESGRQLMQAYDQTLERDPARQINSVKKFLEVKRERSAEEYNAKVRKNGDDGTNSVIKYFKYITNEMLEKYGKAHIRVESDSGTKSKDSRIWTMEDGETLRRMITDPRQGEELEWEDAVALLAQALWIADANLGYIDMGENKTFQMSDYYNLADFMLIEHEGRFYIRSLEQIATAFKSRISDEAIQSGDYNRVHSEMQAIYDVLGTPADPMSRAGRDVAIEVLNDVYVHTGYGTIDRVGRALKPYSSEFARNYELIKEIEEQVMRDHGLDPSKVHAELPSRRNKGYKANRRDRYRKPIQNLAQERFMNLWETHREEAQKLVQISFPNRWQKSWINGELEQGRVPDENGQWTSVFDYLGRPTDRGRVAGKDQDGKRIEESPDFELAPQSFIPGPQNLVYIYNQDDLDWIEPGTGLRAVEACRKYGINVAFTDPMLIPTEYIDDTLKMTDDVYMIPFFDIMLNGGVSNPIAPAPAQYAADPTNLFVSYEDDTYEIEPGDSSAHFTQEGVDTIHVFKDGDLMLDIRKMFPNIIRDEKIGIHNNATFRLRTATKSEIYDWIVSGQGFVDVGELYGSEGYRLAQARYEQKLREYEKRLNNDEVNEDGWIDSGFCHYDSIVGFMALEIIGTSKDVVFAPIIPFHMGDQARAPESYRLRNVEADMDTMSAHVKWEFSPDTRNTYMKFFEGIGASNKMIGYTGNLARSRTLENGIPIHMMYSTATVSSRLFPDNKRLLSLINLFLMCRIDPKYSYNFAESDGSFSYIEDDQVAVEAINAYQEAFMQNIQNGMRTVQAWNSIDDDIKQALFDNAPNYILQEGLLRGFLSRSDWSRVWNTHKRNLRFHTDDEINELVCYFVEQCVDTEKGFQTVNPSILLSTHGIDENGNRERYQMMMTEFEAFMDTGYNFENALLKFFHNMSKAHRMLCPDSISGNSSDTLFKPVDRDGTDEHGVLQMLVPHWDKNGGEYSRLGNVYISMSFFGDDYGSYKRVQSRAGMKSAPTLNVATGRLSKSERRNLLAISNGRYARVPRMRAGFAEFDSDDQMIPVVDKEIEFRHGNFDESLDRERYGKVISVFGEYAPKYIDDDLVNGEERDPETGKLTLFSQYANVDYWNDKVDQFIEYCRKHGIRTIICGTHPGFETAVAWRLYNNKMSNSNEFVFVLAVPFEEYGIDERDWSRKQRAELAHLARVADKVVYVCDGNIQAKPQKMIEVEVGPGMDENMSDSDEMTVRRTVIPQNFNEKYSWPAQQISSYWVINNSDYVYLLRDADNRRGATYNAQRIYNELKKKKKSMVLKRANQS